ncbi:DUF3891 family protein [Paenibacillus sambharensis]|uniref:DUF3891 family protein n=1 Tax=Paenibacillus sambharensis TaxID=1803190 RepID=UPI001FEBC89A|nr:DUF3891 family protein [Paenibacillus sambharensis]
MIIRETNHGFILIAQHDHGQLSGQIARHFRPAYIMNQAFTEDVLAAITEHDRSWIALDSVPIWNDKNRAPYSFLDYPLQPKVVLYRYGIDQIEQMNPYAALLCSLHYASFRVFHNTEDEFCLAFYEHETRRQERLRAQLSPLDSRMVESHFRMLQLCDDLSLYVCLNEAGADKKHEHPWYRSGFAGSEPFSPDGKGQLSAVWLNQEDIAVTPFPFTANFTASLRYKFVTKELICETGIHEAYTQTEWSWQTVRFAAAGPQEESNNDAD